jgi:hypothetical protein
LATSLLHSTGNISASGDIKIASLQGSLSRLIRVGEPDLGPGEGERSSSLPHASHVRVGERDGQNKLADFSVYPAIRPMIDQDNIFLPPGKGVVTDERCGDYFYLGQCEVDPDHFKIPLNHNCGRALCPSCYTRWLIRSTERAGNRIWGLREALDYHVPYPHHVIFSPVAGTHYKSVDSAFSACSRVVRKAGARGFMIVYHPWRVHRDSPERNWVSLLKRDDWKEWIIPSPHFHVITYGHLLSSREFKNKTNWIYKNKGPLKTVEDVRKRVYYVLTHTAAPWEGKNAVRYYGALSARNLRVVESYRIAEWVTCPICGAFVEIVSKDGIPTGDYLSRKRLVQVFAYVGPPWRWIND